MSEIHNNETLPYTFSNFKQSIRLVLKLTSNPTGKNEVFSVLPQR